MRLTARPASSARCRPPTRMATSKWPEPSRLRYHTNRHSIEGNIHQTHRATTKQGSHLQGDRPVSLRAPPLPVCRIIKQGQQPSGVGFWHTLRVIDASAHHQTIAAFPAPRGPVGQFEECVGGGMLLKRLAQGYLVIARDAVSA